MVPRSGNSNEDLCEMTVLGETYHHIGNTMRFYFFIVGILLLLVTISLHPAVAQDQTKAESSGQYGGDQSPSMSADEAYRIGAGDILSLSVWKDPVLSRQVVVLSDGTISLPLIGQIAAADKSVVELEKEIKEKFKRYLPDPVFDISVNDPQSMVIYVIGNVDSPGQYPIRTDIKVLQAIAMAGGLGDWADKNKIKIYREENGKTRFYLFEYDNVIKGEKLEQNIKLQRGDVVVVP